jgi:crossover junction endodeoxyribonuclease RuvC
LKIAGIDPSSSCCGVALLENNNLLLTDAWLKTKNKSSSENLVDYFVWLQNWLAYNKPDVAIIEFLSVVRNAEATRKIAHYQAISSLVCKLRGMMVIEARATSARKAALGKGNLSKRECFDQIKKKFPDHKFKRFDGSGADETDATVLALAGPSIAER